MENQKKLFIAEENFKARKEKEEAAAKEVAKESEIASYEKLGDIEQRDPRLSSLKFMYAIPQPSDKSGTKSGSVSAGLSVPSSASVSSSGDDDMVRAFKERLLEHQQRSVCSLPSATKDNVATDSLTAIENGDGLRSVKGASHLSFDNNYGLRENFDNLHGRDCNASSKSQQKQQQDQKRQQKHDQKRSRLERAVGHGGSRAGLNQAELVERHPALKNAPVEGDYARHIALSHKPFSQVVRNVQCTRCAGWGHKWGDRECPMRDHYNPYDAARQAREDPLTYIRSKDFHLDAQQDKQLLVRQHASAAAAAAAVKGMTSISASSSTSSSTGTRSNENYSESSEIAKRGGDINEDRHIGQIDENESSDPEGDVINSLTRREKKLLVRKLQMLQQKAAEGCDKYNSNSTGCDSAARKSSSNKKKRSRSSSSSSGSSSDSDSSRSPSNEAYGGKTNKTINEKKARRHKMNSSRGGRGANRGDDSKDKSKEEEEEEKRGSDVRRSISKGSQRDEDGRGGRDQLKRRKRKIRDRSK